MWGLSRVGYLGTWEWVEAGFSWGVGMKSFESVPSIWG